MASPNEEARKKIMPRTVADNPQLGVAARRFLCLANKADGHPARSPCFLIAGFTTTTMDRGDAA
jgi:hypothetical protein